MLWQWVTFYWRTNGPYVISPKHSLPRVPARGRYGDKADVFGFAIMGYTLDF